MEKQVSVERSLKNYCAFLMNGHLEPLAKDLFDRAKEMNLPILRLFAHLKDEDVINQNKNSWKEFLLNVADGTEISKFQEKIEQWKSQQHKISHQDLTSTDAVLIHSIRKFCLIKYLPIYTSDIHEYHSIFLEIENLFSQLKETTVSAYSDVQKQLFEKDKAHILNSKELLDTVVKSSVDGIMAYDRNFNVIIWNKALEEINKIPKEKILGKKIWDFFPDYHKSPFTEMIEAVLNEGKTFHLPATEYKYKPGYFETYFTPLLNENKKIQGALTVVRDVTERVLNEKLIKEKNDFIEGITSSTPDLIFLFDLKELKHLYLSNPDSEILAYNSSVSGEKEIFNSIHPDDFSILKERGEKILNASDQDVIEDEFRTLDKNGNWRWLNSRIKIFKRDESGEPVQAVGSIRDISQRKETENRIKANKEILRRMNEELEIKVKERTKELFEKETELRIITNAIPALISYVGRDLRYKYVNDAYSKWFELEREEIVGKTLPEVLGEEAYRSIQSHVEKAFGGEVAKYEVLIPYKKVSHKNVRATYVPHFNSDGKVIGFIALVIDVTEEKKREEELRRSQSNLKDFVENATIGLHWVNREGVIMWANKAELDMLGYSPEEYIGQSVKKFHVDQENIDNMISCLLRNESIKDREVQLICKDGSVKTVLVDSSGYWENGEFIHSRCFIRDITFQKSASKEILRKNEELQKINADLDNFIYTASHDLKAPVSNIEGLLSALSDVLTEEVRSRDEVVNILNLINVSINRFKNTIRDLTEISKVQKGLQESEEENHLEELLTEIKWDIRDIISSHQAEVVTELEIPQIKFARKNLRSILYNLISNAIKYSSPDRKPKVMVSTQRVEEGILLTVKDNGLGISPEYKDKIFFMFKRAHDHVDGSGIGLYIVKRIIENNGGKIQVESKVGEGSVFRIFLKEK